MDENKQIVKSGKLQIAALNELKDVYKSINDFRAALEAEPPKKNIRKNKQVRGEPDYMPIDIVVNELNTVFSGLWNCDIVKTETIANEFVVTVSLEVFHPVAGVWLRRGGIGAAQIRMQKDALLTDYNSKLKVALSADAPHALAEAMKNAAKKYGRRFGGSLNREDSWLEFQDIDDVTFDRLEVEEVLKAVEEYDSVNEVKFAYEALDDEMKRDPRVREAFKARIRTLKGGKDE